MQIEQQSTTNFVIFTVSDLQGSQILMNINVWILIIFKIYFLGYVVKLRKISSVKKKKKDKKEESEKDLR